MSVSIVHRGQRLKADLTLLVVAAAWGSAFVVCRLAAAQTGSFLYNGARFLLGVLTLLPFVGARWRGFTRVEVWGGALAGALLFAASGLQQMGLQFTTAGNPWKVPGARPALSLVCTSSLCRSSWRWCGGSGHLGQRGPHRFWRQWDSFC